MFFYVAIIISIIGLVIATYTDLKERMVRNKLNFSLAGIGLTIYAIQSIFELTPYPFLFSLFGLFFGFFFGWILWKGGVFAGGDVKLFMALGALNPFTPALLKIGAFTNSSIPLFPITLFLYSLFAFLPYGIFISLYKLKTKKEQRTEIITDIKRKMKQGIHFSFFLAGIHIILGLFIPIELFVIEIVAVIILSILWGLLKNKKVFVTIIVVAIALIISYLVFIQTLIGTIVVVVGLYGILKLLLSMKPLLSTKIKVSNLEEGMIPGKTLIWKGKKVMAVEGLSVKKIVSATQQGKLKDLFSPKKVIVSAIKARGLNEIELKQLKELSFKGLIGKEMLVKDSVPFVPTILISYLLCLIFGDVLILLFTMI
jgi:archaeal preflagellin peptidase FlaK